MNCSETGQLVKWFNKKMTRQRVSLDCSLFLNSFYNYKPEYREALLDFQYDALKHFPKIGVFFEWVDKKIQRKLEKDVSCPLEKERVDEMIPL